MALSLMTADKAKRQTDLNEMSLDLVEKWNILVKMIYDAVSQGESEVYPLLEMYSRLTSGDYSYFEDWCDAMEYNFRYKLSSLGYTITEGGQSEYDKVVFTWRDWWDGSSFTTKGSSITGMKISWAATDDD
jgi:hypothetical protein